MNRRASQSLIDEINALPAERIAQVEDFVRFLASEERRRQAIARLQALRERVPLEEITNAEMQQITDTVKEVRAQMRAERERSGRP